MKKPLLLFVLSLSLLVPSAVAAAGQGSIDPEFGRGGKIVQPFGAEEGLGAARLGVGHIFMTGTGRVEALTPGGQIDPWFGDAGFVSLVRPQGGMDAGISTLLVDSQDRLLVFGNCTFPAENTYLGFYSLGIVERFTPDGHLDPSFGDDGIVLVDPGLRAEPPTTQPQAVINAAAFDSEGGIVFAGFSSGSRPSKGSFIGTSETFLGRLGPEGEVDRSFSADGLLPVRATERIETLAPDATGGVYVSANKGPRRVLFHLGSDGAIDRGFGENGFRMQPDDALDGPVFQGATGGLLIYRYLSSRPAHHLVGGVQVKRLLPDGRLDRSFGHDGVARVRVPGMEGSRLRIDDEGRILVASELNAERGRGRTPGTPALSLMRLDPDGSLDAGFGRSGILRVRYPKGWILRLHGLDVVGDEALISGFWYGREDRHAGRTLARIHLGG